MRAAIPQRQPGKLNPCSHERVTEALQGWPERARCYSPPTPDAETTGNLQLTAATGFKRLGIALLAAIAGGLLVLTTAGYLISADTVRQQVLDEIRGVTGLDPVLRGKASVSLFPTGGVSFDDVIL